jgi:predicted dehydrogenase
MSKLRLIQCGMGGWGHSWLKDVCAVSPDFEIAAIVDISREHLDKAGTDSAIPPGRRFSDLASALASVEADAVLSVTPPPVHIEDARLAFARGLHFMTEKPFADTIDHAREMLRLARDSGRQLLISQNYRYQPFLQLVRQLITDRVVGSLGHGHIDFYAAADLKGTFREKMEFPLLIDLAIHHLDLIRFVTQRNIIKVTTLGFRPDWSWYAHQPGLKMLLELEDDVAFSYSGDWSARGRAMSYNGHWRLQCAEGSIHLENNEVEIVRSEKWGKNLTTERLTPVPLELTNRAATLHQFAESIQTGQPCEINGASNIWSFAAVVAGVESARTGLPVDVRKLVG